MRFKAEIMNEDALKRALVRIAHEILERNNGSKNLVIVGIKTRGLPIAERLAENIKAIDGSTVPVGILGFTMSNERESSGPIVSFVQLPDNIVGKDVIIVDDVLYTGRTVRSAMEAVLNHGRTKTIQFAALVDRGHRELPIRADYVGKNIPTSRTEIVSVSLKEVDGVDNVQLYNLKD